MNGNPHNPELDGDRGSITVDDLWFRYERDWVLRGVSFSIRPGEVWGIIGPNGAGKSTLLRCISGTRSPERGRILLEGRRLDQMSRMDVARTMSVVPQEAAIVFPFGVLEIVLMGRSPFLGRFEMAREGDIEIARESMEVAECWDLRERRITELSGGERRRVMIAKALAQSPRMILLDEPTSHLDIGHQVQVLAALSDLSRSRGVTIVATMHDLNLASRFCDRLVLMAAGEIVAEGTARELLVPDLIERVYHVQPHIAEDPESGVPMVFVAGRKMREERKEELPGGPNGGKVDYH
jgi:iron complex transport system ATP-binding protein